VRECLQPFGAEFFSSSLLSNIYIYIYIYIYIKIKIYRTVSLHVVLYGCETWFFTLKKGH